MSHDQNDNEKADKKRHIPDSSTKKARGSKSVHSELDDSTEDGFKPNKEQKNPAKK